MKFKYLSKNLHLQRFAALRGRAWHARLLQALTARLAGPDGRLALTFEIVYGHAFKPALRIPVGDQSAVSLDEMRAMLLGASRKKESP